MAYAGDKPWHGLGNKLATPQPIEMWKRQAGMDWMIEESEVRYITGNHTVGAIHSFPEQKVLYRSDTKRPLAVVSKRFQVVQTEEVLEFYRDLTEHAGFELETAGVLKEGRKFWALARTGQSTTLKGKDQVNGYLLLATACDGSLATTAQFTSVRVVCNNTLAIALRGASANAGVVKVPHSTKFDADSVKQQLGISVRGWDEHMYEMKQLTQRKVSQSEAAAYFDAVFNNTTINPAINNSLQVSQAQQEDNIIQYYRDVATQVKVEQNSNTQSISRSTKAKAEATIPNGKAMTKTMQMFNGQGRGAGLSSAKDTAYGLLCAMTEFVDHERRAMSTDHRLDSAWFGNGAALKQRSLEQALALA
ncbi:MAG: DUF932 domain-containing protein [Sphingobacteriales bacterium]|nr:MAG: DUF932 domain-containing protein [Sphingobacteriales bacterium]